MKKTTKAKDIGTPEAAEMLLRFAETELNLCEPHAAAALVMAAGMLAGESETNVLTLIKTLIDTHRICLEA
jgi:hypothetical protein